MIDWLNETLCSTQVTTASAIVKMLISMLLGCCVGYERKRRGQMAGIRTFALISMGATLAMLLSIYVPQEYLGLKNGDPGRIAAQVVTGIGFLGAGAIIQMKGSVRGLTTAAGIWVTAAIGMAVGVGLYLLSIASTVLILVVLVTIERIEKRLRAGVESRIIRLRVPAVVTDVDDYRRLLADNGITLSDVYVEIDYTEPATRLNFVILARENTDFFALFEKLRSLRPVTAASLANQVSI